MCEETAADMENMCPATCFFFSSDLVSTNSWDKYLALLAVRRSLVVLSRSHTVDVSELPAVDWSENNESRETEPKQ